MPAKLVRTLLKSYITNFTSKRLAGTATYKTAILKERAQPLVIEERPRQKLGKTDVRIKVHYCSVNSLDCINFHNETKELPFTPGYELSGEVTEVGKEVTIDQLNIGQRIAALSLEKFGGFAEECVIDVNDCFKLPTDVTSKDAAVLLCGHSTAVYTFSKLRPLHEGEFVVVSASSGGLGLAAIDVAVNMYKTNVIAVTDNEKVSELMRERGVFRTVLYSDKLKKDVSEITKKKGVAVIYDAVGDFMMDHIGNSISPTGHIFHTAPFHYTTVPAPLPNSSLSIVSLHALRQQNFELYKVMVGDTLDLANDGILSAYISAEFKMADINQAIEYIQSKKSTGKVLIEMNNS